MTDGRYRFEVLRNLLRRPVHDPAVAAVFGAAAIGAIRRQDHYGYLELHSEGFDVSFQKAPFVVPADEVVDPNELLVSAYHLRQEGHDGYAEYSLELPGGIKFTDTSESVRSKLGDPDQVGGGTYIAILKQIAPRFWRYPLGAERFHIEFDNADRVHMVTLQVPSRLKDLAGGKDPAAR